MADFAVECGGLDPYHRRRVARHLLQTHNLNFGGTLRMDAAFFSVPGGPVALRQLRGEAAEENALRLLGEAFEATGPVRIRLASFDKGARYRMSAMLQQSWYRALRETDDDEVVKVLEAAWKQWDRQEKVRGTEDERAYEMGRDAAVREQQMVAAEARERERKVREADRRSGLLVGDEA